VGFAPVIDYPWSPAGLAHKGIRGLEGQVEVRVRQREEEGTGFQDDVARWGEA
jgi:hypothetical protein